MIKRYTLTKSKGKGFIFSQQQVAVHHGVEVKASGTWTGPSHPGSRAARFPLSPHSLCLHSFRPNLGNDVTHILSSHITDIFVTTPQTSPPESPHWGSSQLTSDWVTSTRQSHSLFFPKVYWHGVSTRGKLIFPLTTSRPSNLEISFSSYLWIVYKWYVRITTICHCLGCLMVGSFICGSLDEKKRIREINDSQKV